MVVEFRGNFKKKQTNNQKKERNNHFSIPKKALTRINSFQLLKGRFGLLTEKKLSSVKGNREVEVIGGGHHISTLEVLEHRLDAYLSEKGYLSSFLELQGQITWLPFGLRHRTKSQGHGTLASPLQIHLEILLKSWAFTYDLGFLRLLKAQCVTGLQTK